MTRLLLRLGPIACAIAAATIACSTSNPAPRAHGAAPPFEYRAGALRFDFAGAPVTVELPLRMSSATRVRDTASGAGVDFRLQDAVTGARARVAGKHVVYRGAAPGGGDVTELPSPSGTEDSVTLRHRPEVPELRYDIALHHVAGLRLVADTLELLDADGAPRLRVASPSVEDAHGVRRAAHLALEGCASDTRPSAPWGRPVTPPGAADCVLRVSWNDAGLDYPLVVDPSWTNTRSMNTRRDYFFAGRLPSGKVLVAGGETTYGSVTAGAELYDETSGTWAVTGSLTTARMAEGVVLPSGTALLFFGYDGSATAGTVEAYDPSTGKWTTTYTTQYPPKVTHAVLLGSGKVLLALEGKSWVYDPATSTLSGAVFMVDNGRSEYAIAPLPNGKVLAAAGSSIGGGLLATAELYDPTKNSWSSTSDLAQPRELPLATVLSDGRVMVASGDNGYSSVDTAEIYDPATTIWSSPIPLVRGHVYGVLLTLPSGSVLAAAGEGYSAGADQTMSELWDPATDTFTAAGDQSTERLNPGAAVLPSGKVLLAGGSLDTLGTAFNSAEIFDPGPPTNSCSSPGDCTSGYCVDGVCCDTACTGTCMACSAAKKGGGFDGQCGPIKAGTDPDNECADQGASSCGTDGACNGAGACRDYAQGTPCGSTTCSGNSVTGQICDGLGACVDSTGGSSCSPYLCVSGACTTSCANDAQCVAGTVCYQGACKTKSADGAACSSATTCQSGYCVDGVCCATACNGKCSACSYVKKGSGADGTCGPIAAGSDPDGECAAQAASTCGQSGSCDGAGACALYSAGTVCAAASCSGAKETSAGTCDGKGSCTPGTTSSCVAGYACSGNACATDCTDNTSCAAGYTCDTTASACVRAADGGTAGSGGSTGSGGSAGAAASGGSTGSGGSAGAVGSGGSAGGGAAGSGAGAAGGSAGSSGAPNGGSAGSSSCVPGQQIACACPDGTQGAQTCAADGQSYEACVCGAADAGTQHPGSSSSGGCGCRVQRRGPENDGMAIAFLFVFAAFERRRSRHRLPRA